ncbi:unnamed protein product [Adineta ricciae]|uniref:Uncharacterized protein n=1 Tax=Adineta ricciae TaxID=249248 RepID=A0A815BA31_ADIRI|nr:unnamed protein product [Adineta ricciae]CAF1408943.1 unnamed protein product [Adineta ricciae]
MTSIGGRCPMTSLYHSERSFETCDCASSAKCVRKSALLNNTSGAVIFTVPGIYIGCYVVEALLQSDLTCFYNQTCITQLQSYLFSRVPINVTVLDKSVLLNFSENSTVEAIIDELMVDEWDKLILYKNYYNECKPTKCIYTYETKYSIIYIITILAGLIGGLTTALKLIVPRVVSVIAFCLRKWKLRHATIMPTIQT